MIGLKSWDRFVEVERHASFAEDTAPSYTKQAMPKSTPMMEQYLRIKADHPVAILFFHLRYFYKAFFDDKVLIEQQL